MTHASAAAGSAPTSLIPLLQPAEAAEVIKRTYTTTPDMAVPPTPITHRLCLELGNDNIGNIIERTGAIASLPWGNTTIPQLIEKGYQLAFPDKTTQNQDRKYAFAMAALEEMDTSQFTRDAFLNIIEKVKAHFTPRAELIEKLITTGIITTDRAALIEANKYSAMDNAHFVTQDFAISFKEITDAHGTLGKETNEREIVEVIANGESVKCLKYNVRGNGDCGLIALGLKRSDIQKAFASLKGFMHTGTDSPAIDINEMKERLFKNPTDNGENAHIDTSDAAVLGYLFYGARTYVQYAGDSPHAEHFHIRSTLQNHYIGDENFTPDAPKMFLKLSGGHFEILVPENDIKLRKHAAHIEFYSALSSLVAQAYANKHDGTLNRTELDEWVTHCSLEIPSDKLQFDMDLINQIVDAYDTHTPESLANIPNIIANMLL